MDAKENIKWLLFVMLHSNKLNEFVIWVVQQGEIKPDENESKYNIIIGRKNMVW